MTPQTSPPHIESVTLTDPDAVIVAERDRIAKMRDGFDEKDAWALAHSGGGIRSAAFALGVQHGLLRVRRDDYEWTKSGDDEGERLISRFDYLSTVSGGGYTGTALTWHLGHMDAKAAPLSAVNYPLSGTGTRKEDADTKDKPPAKPKSLDWIRHNASYLNAQPGHSLCSLIGTTLRGVVHAGLVHFALTLAAMSVLALIVIGTAPIFVAWTDWLLPYTPVEARRFAGTDFDRHWIALWLWIACFGVGIGVAAALVYGIVTVAARRIERSAKYALLLLRWRSVAGIWACWTLATIAGALAMSGVGWVAEAIRDFDLVEWIASSGGPAAIGAGGVVWRMIIERGQGKAFGTKGAATIAAVAAIAISAIFFVGAYLTIAGFAHGKGYFDGTHFVLSQADLARLKGLAVFASTCGLVVGVLCNINLTSPHRLYRDALMRTFMRDLGEANRSAAAHPETAKLKDACGGTSEPYGGPYHLICANVVLAASEKQPYRDRSGDSWLFSPLFVGSRATGWREPSNSLSLATAMAVSGAAANPYAGGAGRGVTRDLPGAFVMSLFNLRLGLSWSNPAGGANWPPNLIDPGLANLIGKGQREDSRFVELTDGGHFENTALYELFRRKARVIFLTDAGCDPAYQFEDLGNALVRARVDFGVNVDFEGGIDPTQLACRRDKDDPVRPLTTDVPVAWGLIDYGKDGKGILVVFKPTLIDRLPLDLAAYARTNTAFPQETTADQFFDETQFEAYRELGYQLVKRAFADDKLRKKLQAMTIQSP